MTSKHQITIPVDALRAAGVEAGERLVARAALAHALDHNDRLVMPASAFAEALVGPSRAGREAVATVEHLMARFPIEVVPLSQDITSEAALVELNRIHDRAPRPDGLHR